MDGEIVNETTLTKPTFEMEIEVKIPEDMPIVEHNLDKLEKYAIDLNDFYSKLVIEEKDKKDAEDEKSKLNKIIEKVKRLRIDSINRYKEPIDDFEKTAKRVESILGEASNTIKNRLDIFEDRRKQEKFDKVIVPLINAAISDAFNRGYLIDKNRIETDKRWFNKTFKDDDIEKDIKNQIEEMIREEDELRKGIEVIKSNIAMSNNKNLNEEMYIERFKYNRDLTSVLNDIARDNNVSHETIKTNVTDNQINDIFSATETINLFSVTFRGTPEQIKDIKIYAKSLGLEEV